MRELGTNAIEWGHKRQAERIVTVDYRIFAGADADFTIKRGDIVNVGTHPFAPFLERIRGLTLPTPANRVGWP